MHLSQNYPRAVNEIRHQIDTFKILEANCGFCHQPVPIVDAVNVRCRKRCVDNFHLDCWKVILHDNTAKCSKCPEYFETMKHRGGTFRLPQPQKAQVKVIDYELTNEVVTTSQIPVETPINPPPAFSTTSLNITEVVEKPTFNEEHHKRPKKYKTPKRQSRANQTKSLQAFLVEDTKNITRSQDVAMSYHSTVSSLMQPIVINPWTLSMYLCYSCYQYPIATTNYPCYHSISCHFCAPFVNTCLICQMPVSCFI